MSTRVSRELENRLEETGKKERYYEKDLCDDQTVNY